MWRITFFFFNFFGSWGGGGGELPYMKDGGACQKLFLKDPLRGTKILLCGCGLKLVSSLRGTISKTAHFLLSFFRLNTLKGTAKAPAVWTF